MVESLAYTFYIISDKFDHCGGEGFFYEAMLKSDQFWPVQRILAQCAISELKTNKPLDRAIFGQTVGWGWSLSW